MSPAAGVAVLVNPGRRRGAVLHPLLGHKGAPWLAHITDGFVRADEGRREGLDTRFFVAMADGLPVANVTLWDNGTAGIVGHVYTAPDHRGRGLAGRLFEALLADAQRRGVGFLALNVDPDSFQQRFYARCGFVVVEGVAGAMTWGSHTDIAATGPVVASPFRWADWPELNALSLAPDSPGWRGLGLERRGSIEFAFLDWAFAARALKEPEGAIIVLRQAGRVVGWVSLMRRDEQTGEKGWLDAHVPHEGIEAARASARTLLAEGAFVQFVEPWSDAARELMGTMERVILLKTK